MNNAIDPGLRTRFTEVMAGVCTPVSVVTTLEDTRPHGTTVSAFASLSVDPPMVLAALDQGSDLLTLVRDTGRFGMNILASQQAWLARTFAGKGKGKFDDVEWATDNGLPRLHEASGWLACTLDNLVPGGDHMIALGAVLGAETRPGRPLTYHAREFGTHAAFEGATR